MAPPVSSEPLVLEPFRLTGGVGGNSEFRSRIGNSIRRRPKAAIDGEAESSQQGGRELGLFERPGQPWRAPRRETALSGVALFVVLMAVWLLDSGHYTPLMSASEPPAGN